MEMADIQEKMFPSLIQSFNKGTVAQKNLKYLKEEKKISSFLRSCISKPEGRSVVLRRSRLTVQELNTC